MCILSYAKIQSEYDNARQELLHQLTRNAEAAGPEAMNNVLMESLQKQEEERQSELEMVKSQVSYRLQQDSQADIRYKLSTF